MTIGIVTDSTCDLPDSLAATLGIGIVPLYINFGKESYLDGIQMSRRAFYERLAVGSVHPTTAVPGLGVFGKAYADLAAAGATAIVSIHVGERLSNVVTVARMAADDNPPVPVTVVDSGNLTLGVGLMALRAAELSKAGGSLDDILSTVQDLRKRTYCFAALSTLEFMRRSGRISWLQAGLGGWLQVKPILKMHDGAVSTERVRTRPKAVQRLIDLVTELGPLSDLMVVHTNAPDEAARLRQNTAYLFPAGREPLTAQVTPVIGAHIGPGVVGFVAVAAKAG